jgi:hypothetical protein
MGEYYVGDLVAGHALEIVKGAGKALEFPLLKERKRQTRIGHDPGIHERLEKGGAETCCFEKLVPALVAMERGEIVAHDVRFRSGRGNSLLLHAISLGSAGRPQYSAEIAWEARCLPHP